NCAVSMAGAGGSLAARCPIRSAERFLPSLQPPAVPGCMQSLFPPWCTGLSTDVVDNIPCAGILRAACGRVYSPPVFYAVRLHGTFYRERYVRIALVAGAHLLRSVAGPAGAGAEVLPGALPSAAACFREG